jgi:hypothetical protein
MTRSYWPFACRVQKPVRRPDLGGLAGPQARREAGHTVGCSHVGPGGEVAVAIRFEAVEEHMRLELVGPSNGNRVVAVLLAPEETGAGRNVSIDPTTANPVTSRIIVAPLR